MRELRLRGIIRTNNNPVGDIAEAIVAIHYQATAHLSISADGMFVRER